MTPDAYDSSPPRGTPAPWTRVYLKYGKYAHLERDGRIACRDPRRETSWMGDAWLGTGSQEEYEKAASLPLHRKCFAVRERARPREGYDPADPGERPARCDPALPSAQSPVPHDYDPAGAEYDSLANGGSYERLRCTSCGRIACRPLPD